VTILATIILAFGMSMDSFAAALSKGACLKHPTLKEAVRIGIIFGAIEFVTPILGWALGYVASSYVMAWDHWIIFGLLSLLGGRMIIAGLNSDNSEDCSPPERHGVMVLVLTAIATSLDALAVGVGLAFLQVNILTTSLMIGLMTAVMATAGVILGRFIGPILGRWSEILGGLVLIGIGTTILLQHLWFLS
jgi:manganese efflux pump family protein